MFTQVYMHRTRRIYDIYLSEIVKLWNPDFDPLTKVLNYDDVDFMTYFKACTADPTNPCHKISTLICCRQHPSVIYETSEFADHMTLKEVKGIFEKLTNKYQECNFIIDLEAKGTIHKFYVRGDEDAGDEFPVIHNDRDFLVTDLSKIIDNMKKKFHVVRIYASTNNKATLMDLKEDAKVFEREVKER
jgi:hypothetical protein